MQRGKYTLLLTIEVENNIKTSMDPECLQDSTHQGFNRIIKIIIAPYKTFINNFKARMLISIFKV